MPSPPASTPEAPIETSLSPTLGLERASELRSQLTNVEVESGAINQLLSQVTGGGMSVRQLAAYPTFIKSSAVSDLVSQLSTLETERLKLLGTRTEQDPAVQAVAKSIASVEGQLKPLAQAYAARRRTVNGAVSSLVPTVPLAVT